MEPDKDTSQVADSERGELIEGMVLDIIQRQNVTKVRDVITSLQRLDKHLASDEIHDALKRLEGRGEVNLSEEKLSRSFFGNLADFEANAPFWIAIISTAVILLATFALPQDGAWVAAKTIGGAVFLFVMPGYVLINTLIARNRISFVERLAVSVGLSLAVVSFIGIVLAYSISGIRLEPVIVTLTVYVVGLAFIGAFRDYARRRQARQLHTKFLDQRAASRQ